MNFSAPSTINRTIPRARRYCPACNRCFNVAVNAKSDLCPACLAAEQREARQIAKRDARDATKLRRLGANGHHRVTILHDPLPVEEGGYLPGAQFDAIDISTMLASSSMADGTRLEYRGIPYTVRGPLLLDASGAAFALYNQKVVRRKHPCNAH